MDNSDNRNTGYSARVTASFQKTLHKKLERIRHLLTEETVTEVTITENGDIDLQLTTLRITAFCTGSDEDEMWRFFEVRTGSPHIVRNGCGYELI